MKQFIKIYWKTLLFFAIVGIIGGFFTGIYVLDSYPPEMQQQLLNELAASGLGDFPPDIIMGIITAMQAACYGILLGAAGIWLGKKTGLWKGERTITKQPLIASVIVSIVGGASLILSDLLFFGKYLEVIMSSYSVKPTISYLIAAVIYGGLWLHLFCGRFLTERMIAPQQLSSSLPILLPPFYLPLVICPPQLQCWVCLP